MNKLFAILLFATMPAEKTWEIDGSTMHRVYDAENNVV